MVSHVFGYDILTMSLVTGLDLLAGLKELYYFDCDPDVTEFWSEPNQRWAKEHWPKYYKIHPESFWNQFGCWVSGEGCIDDPFAV